jgi:hypothetical protein
MTRDLSHPPGMSNISPRVFLFQSRGLAKNFLSSISAVADIHVRRARAPKFDIDEKQSLPPRN